VDWAPAKGQTASRGASFIKLAAFYQRCFSNSEKNRLTKQQIARDANHK
jgi:hypothetical protein